MGRGGLNPWGPSGSTSHAYPCAEKIPDFKFSNGNQQTAWGAMAAPGRCWPAIGGALPRPALVRGAVGAGEGSESAGSPPGAWLPI